MFVNSSKDGYSPQDRPPAMNKKGSFFGSRSTNMKCLLEIKVDGSCKTNKLHRKKNITPCYMSIHIYSYSL